MCGVINTQTDRQAGRHSCSIIVQYIRTQALKLPLEIRLSIVIHSVSIDLLYLTYVTAPHDAKPRVRPIFINRSSIPIQLLITATS